MGEKENAPIFYSFKVGRVYPETRQQSKKTYSKAKSTSLNCALQTDLEKDSI